ncbi:hypothetical protein G6L37_07405 [Agrobacterium rubi]|nr:hypothetical protein [Agrobacterium rubi]NTF25194.1 hypothetical protein [Agrobacterium rubi]
MTDIAEMDIYQVSAALEEYADEKGFQPAQAFYISGGFNLKDADGASVYSDEGHLWCECCAETLLERAKALLPQEKWEDLEVCATCPSNEDTCPHCMECGETLDGSVSGDCVKDELEHYAISPIDPDDEVNPRMAIELKQVLLGAYDEDDQAAALALGRSALEAIARSKEAAPSVPA